MTTWPVRIEVVDIAGRPVQEAAVVVPQASVPFPEMAMLTDESGATYVLLALGWYVFRANTLDGRSGETECDFATSVPHSIRITVTH